MNNSDNNRASGVPLAVRVILGAVSVTCAACAGLYLYNATVHRTDAAPGEVPGDVPGDFAATPDVSSATVAFKDPEGAYRLMIPAGWRVTAETSSSIVVSAARSPCSITMASFPPVVEEDRAQWISRRIGGYAARTVREDASEAVTVGGAPGVRWTGTIGGAGTEFVYAFAPLRTFEIAPSPGGDAGTCGDAMETFLEGVTFPPAPPVVAGIVRGASTTAASGTVLAGDTSSEEYCE